MSEFKRYYDRIDRAQDELAKSAEEMDKSPTDASIARYEMALDKFNESRADLLSAMEAAEAAQRKAAFMPPKRRKNPSKKEPTARQLAKLENAWHIFDKWFDRDGHWMYGTKGIKKAEMYWEKYGIDGLPDYPGPRPRKNPSKKREPTARQLAKKVHKAIHPLEHDTRKTAKKKKATRRNPENRNDIETKIRRAQIAKKTTGAAMAREALADIKKAGQQFEAFTGLKAENVTPAPYRAPKTAVVIGKLVAVIYEAERLDVQGYEGEDDIALYKHEFSAKNPPVLAVSPDGKQLVIVGGGYHFDAKKGGIIG